MNDNHKAELFLIYCSSHSYSVFVLRVPFLFCLFSPNKSGTMIWHKMLLGNTVNPLDCGYVCSYQAKWIWSIAERRSSSSHRVPGPSHLCPPCTLMASCSPWSPDRRSCCPAQSKKGRDDTAHAEHSDPKGGIVVTNGWRVVSMLCSYYTRT